MQNIGQLSKPLGSQGNPFIERSVIDPYTGQAYTYYMGQGDMSQYDPSLAQAISSDMPQSNYARQVGAAGWDAPYKAESQRLQQAVAANRAAAERFLSGQQTPQQRPQYNDITGAFIGDPELDPRKQGAQQMATSPYSQGFNMAQQPTGFSYGGGSYRGPAQSPQQQMGNDPWGGRPQPGMSASGLPFGYEMGAGNRPASQNPSQGTMAGMQIGNPMMQQGVGGTGGAQLGANDWRNPSYVEQPQQSFGQQSQQQPMGAWGSRDTSAGRLSAMFAPGSNMSGRTDTPSMGGYPSLGAPGFSPQVPQQQSPFSQGGQGMSFQQAFNASQPQQYQFGTVNGVPFGSPPPSSMWTGFGGSGGMQYGGGSQGGGGGQGGGYGFASPTPYGQQGGMGGQQPQYMGQPQMPSQSKMLTQYRPPTQYQGQGIRDPYASKPWGNVVR